MAERTAAEVDNIVFDMGMCLADFDPMKAIHAFTGDAATAHEVLLGVYAAYEWALLDLGVISEAEFLDTVLPRLDSDAAREVGRQSFLSYERYNLSTKPGMDRVLADLSARGQKIWVLSNAGVRIRPHIDEIFPRPDLISGYLFSAEEMCLKPERAIYQRFFEKFGLRPADCFFIDDLQRNVDGAARAGMSGYCFADGDVAELRKVLGLPAEG